MKALNVNKLTRCGVTFKFWSVLSRPDLHPVHMQPVPQQI